MNNSEPVSTDKLRVEQHGRVLLMRINRPEAGNAIDLDVLQQLAHHYTQLSESRELRCGVLCGEGDMFTLGLDLPSALPRMVAEGPQAYLREGQCDPFGLFGPACAKPVIVAVHHRCYTAGLELTLAADMCVAAKGTIFRQHEVTRGVFPFGGATLRLPQMVGWHNAMRYILAGDSFDAEEGQRMGLVQVLSEPCRQVDDALTLAERISACASLGVQAALANARIARTQGARAALDDMQVRGRQVAASKDAMEGVLSMVQRRKAMFTGE